MTHHHQQRAWKTFIVFTLLIGLLLILTHTPGHTSPACFVLLPVLFFGLVDIPSSLWPLAPISLNISHQRLEHSFLFQRPPPIALA